MVLMETMQFVSSSGRFPTGFTKVRLLSCSRYVYVALKKKLKVFHFPLITFGLYALLPAKIIILPKNAFKWQRLTTGEHEEEKIFGLRMRPPHPQIPRGGQLGQE